MLKISLILSISFSILFSTVFSQVEKARRITEILCSDSLYGRGYVKNGVNKAADFLAKEYSKAGLKPYFEDSSFFQPFTLDVNTFPNQVELSVNGNSLTPGIDFVIDPMSGGGSGQMEFIYLDSSIMENPEELKPMVARVKNEEANAFFVNLEGVSRSLEAELQYQLKGLGRFGPVIFTTSRKFTWAVGRGQLKHPVYIVKSDKISSTDSVEYSVDAKMEKDFTSRNVVGFLPGKRKNAKTVVFTAHYDHLGGMGTEISTFFPGANDNASGTAMLISMADYFRENRTKYNMLFIAFAGEEAGLVGSKYFVENSPIEMKKIKFLLNLDIMGSGERGITVVNGAVLKKPFKKLKKINQKRGYLKQVKKRGETQNSDHHYFYQEGVPSFFIYTMGGNTHYHDVYDTYEELGFAAYNDVVKLLIDFVEKL
tara:strand:- start:148260 stop:149537 length:1278 start_codon:yes stop_codon:yes gene_type:complete